MTPDVIRQMLTATPFRPFRVVTASGNSYLIPGRDWMLVTSLTSAVGVPGEAGDGDRLILIDNMSITEVVPADPVSAK